MSQPAHDPVHCSGARIQPASRAVPAIEDRAEGCEYSFSERYSTVWVRDRGDWRMDLEYGTVIPDP